MKKVLLAAAVVGAILLATKKKTPTLPTSSSQPTFFQQYEGKIVVDSGNYWMVIKNGKIYTFTDVKSLQKYQSDFPQHATPVQVSFPAWMQYAVNQKGGVTSLPGY